MTTALGCATPTPRSSALPPPGDFSSARNILQQTSAVVEGHVTQISFLYDECAGPRTVIRLTATRTLLGRYIADEAPLVIFGGPAPDGDFYEVSELPRFAFGAHYVVFLRNTHWFYSPLIGELAFRIEEVGGRHVLINTQGQAVTGFSNAGVEVTGPRISEPTGLERGPRAFDRPKLLEKAGGRGGDVPGDPALRRAVTIAEFVDAVRDKARSLNVDVGGDFDPQPSGRCWRTTITRGVR